VSLYDWRYALTQVHADAPFDGLLMAACVRADTDNTQRLRTAWPELWAEAEARYHAPGGLLAGEEDK
jgi:hypothetical protein